MKQGSVYDRGTAVDYALKFGLKPNPSFKLMEVYNTVGGDCTNFISQCLRAGGAPFAFGPLRPWWYDRKGSGGGEDDRWSQSWAVAHSLYWCLRVRYDKRMQGVSAMEVEDAGMLDLGDVIQYQNAKGIIYHSAIVTGFASSSGRRLPLITQHSFNAVNIPYMKAAAKKTHFLKIIVT